MNIVTKRFTSNHINAVAQIEQVCFTHPWSEKALSDELVNDTSHFFVAVDASKPSKVLGYIGMQAIVDGAYITNVAVLPEYRKLGIGDTLLKAVIECACTLGLDFVTLEVRPSNLPAIGLYSKNGFEAVGKRKSFYRDPPEDGLIMTLDFHKQQYD